MPNLDLKKLLVEAATDPAVSFAKLWVAVAKDHSLKEEGVSCWLADKERYSKRIKEISATLDGDCDPPADLVAADALAALQALDAFLEESNIGMLPTHRRCMVEQDSYWLLSRPRGFKPILANQPNQLQYWAPNHWLFPVSVNGIQVDVEPEVKAVSSILEPVMRRGSVRIYTASFEDGIEPKWVGPLPYYLAESLGDTEERWKSVTAALEDAKAQGAHIVVLPELTLCSVLRGRVEDWLESKEHDFCLVVPGSFHVPGKGGHFGETVLLNSVGRVVLTHHKLAPMLVEKKAAENSVREAIRGSARFGLLPSPVGLIVLAICLDYCEENGAVDAFWNQVAPGLILVPSMSNPSTAHAHERRASKLCRAHAAVTAVAIQPSPPDPNGEAPRGLVVGHQTKKFVMRVSQDAVDGSGSMLPWSGNCCLVSLRPLDDEANTQGVGLA
ncbi:hypothetical protein HJC10_25210 [Corallococcus exiguus]|nr:hypothetical protein [Corallococcus exiguus]